MEPAAPKTADYRWPINFEQLRKQIADEAASTTYQTLTKFLEIVAKGTAANTLAHAKPDFCASLLPFIEQAVDRSSYSSTTKKAMRVFAEANAFQQFCPEASQVILYSTDREKVSINRIALQLQCPCFQHLLEQLVKGIKPDSQGDYELIGPSAPLLSKGALELLKSFYETAKFPEDSNWPAGIVRELLVWESVQVSSQDLRFFVASHLNDTQKMSEVFAMQTVADQDHGLNILKLLSQPKWFIGHDTYVTLAINIFGLLKSHHTLEGLCCINARYPEVASHLEQKDKQILQTFMNIALQTFAVMPISTAEELIKVITTLNMLNHFEEPEVQKTKASCLAVFCKNRGFYHEKGVLGIDILPYMVQDDPLGKYLQSHSELGITADRGIQIAENLALSRMLGGKSAKLGNVRTIYTAGLPLSGEAIEALREMFPLAKLNAGKPPQG